MSRAKSRRNLDYTDVLAALEQKGISIRIASPKLVMEEVQFVVLIGWFVSSCLHDHSLMGVLLSITAICPQIIFIDYVCVCTHLIALCGVLLNYPHLFLVPSLYAWY